MILVDDGPAAAAHEEVLANQPAPAALRRLDDGSQIPHSEGIPQCPGLTDDLTRMAGSVRLRTMAGDLIGIAEPATEEVRHVIAADVG
ncbi:MULTISPECIES: hypothetical protein [unclassified Streptomyces]|uniref:hypothetical protein n=1 Tax=unclassified Streptomyces TaxID=2593676 RepID=UPI002E120793